MILNDEDGCRGMCEVDLDVRSGRAVLDGVEQEVGEEERAVVAARERGWEEAEASDHVDLAGWRRFPVG